MTNAAASTLPVLYGYFRSSAAYRVRLALNLKAIGYDHKGVHLLNQGGEHRLPDYLEKNPQALVPAMEIDGTVLTQSMAIMDYLEETRPDHALMPKEPIARANIRAFCQSIACDIHPINNLRILQYLVAEMGVADEKKLSWYRHWTEQGLKQSHALLTQHRAAMGISGDYCYGDQPTLADCCLIPQLYNAHRFQCDLSGLDLFHSAERKAEGHVAFVAAHPDNQPDAT